MRSAWFMVLVTAVWACGGCDRGEQPVRMATTGTAVATVAGPQPSTGTADAEASVLNIAGKDIAFGPARLTLHDREGTVLAQVLAETPGESGDGYYLEMPLEIDGPSQIDGASWQFVAATNERVDSLNGIALDGGATQLQPKDVTVVFHRVSSGSVEVRVNGFFNVFAGREGTAAVRSVPVTGTVIAREGDGS